MYYSYNIQLFFKLTREPNCDADLVFSHDAEGDSQALRSRHGDNRPTTLAWKVVYGIMAHVCETFAAILNNSEFTRFPRARESNVCIRCILHGIVRYLDHRCYQEEIRNGIENHLTHSWLRGRRKVPAPLPRPSSAPWCGS
ncbi:uncharacterized protein LAESUDRAFT_728790 [Laetiporus sulphureus 93-53]|uniref:Uncharacterized protein n=1 Tax=Laetiporus sulphureus 93-53 TaxID=1314785 RepID=A0A165CYS3_9APHY|nr:uncharacterized protein LAESUDRAFT_728790 [Laetiporus sulphureus 93-53]KZT03767.1 hypothetical protein LAESUDRAFT_728790 [Laetiporus sulphureus 93-53]